MLRATLQRLLTGYDDHGNRLLFKTGSAFLGDYLLPTLALLLFCVWWAKSQAIDFNQHNRYLNDLRQLQALDARINQHILQSRLGLLMFYDPITHDFTAVKQIQNHLNQVPTFIEPDERLRLRQQLKYNVQTWQKKNKIFQQFQSQNSILKNSLAYFPIATSKVLNQPEIPSTLAIPLNQLFQDVLWFNISPNDRTLVPKINQEIRLILANSALIDRNVTLTNAIAHARIILNSRPQVDALVKDLMAQPTDRRNEALVLAYDRAYQRALDAANLYRLWFYLLSTVAIISIATLIIFKLQAAANALRRSEQKYRTIFENSQVGIGRTRMDDGLFLEVNRRYAEIMGFASPTDLAGRRFTSDFYVNLGDRHRILAELEARGEVSNFEEPLRRPDGSVVWVLLSLHPNRAENCLDFVATDISLRKQTEEKLQKALEAAKVANQAKSQFLSHMSHELRSPLNVILGFSQLIVRNTVLSPQQQTYLGTINRSGEHLLTLINDVLEMSKIEAGKITVKEHDFDLYALIDVLQSMFQYKAESKGLQLWVERDIHLPQYIRSDESKLRQVLINLLSNAIKFTQIGRVTLRAGANPDDFQETTQETLSIPQSLSARLSFEVEDTGPGIPPSEQDHLFEPFMQTEVGRQSQEGTGLGLSISRKFVALLGGELSCESRVDVGSCFRFTILVHRSQPVPSPIQKRQIVGLEPGQPAYRILVVEDKLENRQLLVELLNSVGFEVQEAANGQEAIALSRRWSPHLIWMDLRMPILDGYQATRQIKSAGAPNPVIIALTSSAFEVDRSDALSIGCNDFLRKPFLPETLFAKMAEHLGVRYRYADRPDHPPLGLPPLSRTPDPSIHLQTIRTMSPEWIAQLHQAALRVNSKQVKEAIAAIPVSHGNLANALNHLVNHCCFEVIVALTQPPKD